MTLFLLMLSQNGLAEPKIIHDTGAARSITDFFPLPAELGEPRPLTDQDVEFIEKEREAALEHMASFFYPIKSSAFSRGKIASRKANYPQINKPFFLIGTDRFSIRWVQLNKQELLKRRAMGFLIKAQSPDDLVKVQKMFPEFTIQPLDADRMAQSLKINKYPVFISSTEVIQ